MRTFLFLTLAISTVCAISATTTPPEDSCPARLSATAPKFPRGVLQALPRFRPPITVPEYRAALDRLNRFLFGQETAAEVRGTPFFVGPRPDSVVDRAQVERFTNLAAAGDREAMEADVTRDVEAYASTNLWRPAGGRTAHPDLENADELVVITHPSEEAQRAFVTWLDGQTKLAQAPVLGLLHHTYAPISRAVAARLTDVRISLGGETMLRSRATRVHIGGDYLEDCVQETIRSLAAYTKARRVEYLIHRSWTTQHSPGLTTLDEEIRSEFEEIEFDFVRADLTAAEPYWVFERRSKRITIRLVP